MMSLITKSLIRSGLIVAAMALTANAAMAANLPVAHKSVPIAHTAHLQATARVAARYRQPPYARNNDLGQLIEGFFGGVLPPQYTRLIASAAARASVSHRGTGESSGTYDPSWDSPSPSIPIDNSASDAAAAAAAANSEQRMNDDMAMTASMAAAQQQNDAANAATLQTEINAGM
jgi:hypothetical protein